MNDKLLKTEEKAVFALRALYDRYGYTPYKMSKFEEYDLYVKNKDFLISEGIITFTDTRGKLLALKPDVTLSIIKNSRDVEKSVSKVYYNENVYRIAKGSQSFKEIMQTGLECIGDIDAYHVAEVVALAIKSLSLISDAYVLDLSHMGLIDALFDELHAESNQIKKLFLAVEKKNFGEIREMVATGALPEAALALSDVLLREYQTLENAKAALTPYLTTPEAVRSFADLSEIYNSLAAIGLADRIRIDFSVLSHRGYYSGVVFRGYVKGVPDSVLAGGRYDRMMRKMGRRDGAVGFAVYLDAIASQARAVVAYDADILLLKGTADTMSVLCAVEKLSAEGKRVFVADVCPEGFRAQKILQMQGGEAVEYGNA